MNLSGRVRTQIELQAFLKCSNQQLHEPAAPPGLRAACRKQLCSFSSGYLAADSPSGLMLKGSRRSLSGSMLLRRSISGTVWSMPIWMRLRIMDISLTFWICSAYLAYRFCRSCIMLNKVSTDMSICKEMRENTNVATKFETLKIKIERSKTKYLHHRINNK